MEPRELSSDLTINKPMITAFLYSVHHSSTAAQTIQGHATELFYIVPSKYLNTHQSNNGQGAEEYDGYASMYSATWVPDQSDYSLLFFTFWKFLPQKRNLRIGQYWRCMIRHARSSTFSRLALLSSDLLKLHLLYNNLSHIHIHGNGSSNWIGLWGQRIPKVWQSKIQPLKTHSAPLFTFEYWIHQFFKNIPLFHMCRRVFKQTLFGHQNRFAIQFSKEFNISLKYWLKSWWSLIKTHHLTSANLQESVAYTDQESQPSDEVLGE